MSKTRGMSMRMRRMGRSKRWEAWEKGEEKDEGEAWEEGLKGAEGSRGTQLGLPTNKAQYKTWLPTRPAYQQDPSKTWLLAESSNVSLSASGFSLFQKGTRYIAYIYVQCATLCMSTNIH